MREKWREKDTFLSRFLLTAVGSDEMGKTTRPKLNIILTSIDESLGQKIDRGNEIHSKITQSGWNSDA